MNVAELRNWITLFFAVSGGCIVIWTYLGNRKQRRLENSFRLVVMFRESLHEKDIEAWKTIFHATSEPAGAKRGYLVEFVDGKRLQRPLSDLFSEGSPDNGAVERMAEFFELISREALNDTFELRLVYFQLGQLMDTIHLWLTTIDNHYGKVTFLEEHYPHFDRLYKKMLIDRKWSKKTYTHTG
ncbi:hypothetical protein [Synechocystis sp. PCC 7509]|uniref:hypothetical protein n=1 Tax=Synechocystis sp. PCC 7509 TaxID=927677 RepID=UPI0002AC8CAB|nr:hypothetical protein [Synechocystis sp. PCC 7509]